MKEQPKLDANMLEKAISELRAQLDWIEAKYGTDPLAQADTIVRVNAILREQGHPEEKLLSPFLAVEIQEDIGYLEKQLERLKQIDLFNLKYGDYFKEEPTLEKVQEFVRDVRWMLPTFKQFYGEKSKYYQQLSTYAALNVEEWTFGKEGDSQEQVLPS